MAGSLLVPVLVDRRLEHAVVDIPPPAPWTADHLETMWRAAASLEAARVLDVPLRLVGRRAHEHAPGLDWEALSAALAQAEALTLRWPMRRQERLVVAATDTPRGIEDEQRTLQAAAIGRVPIAPGSPTRLERAVYRHSVQAPWRSAGLAHDLGRLLAAVAAALPAPDTEVAQALVPLHDARTLAAPPGPRSATREPPLSSWPPPAARLAWIVRQALARVERAGAAADRAVPVRAIWQLYQDWVAVEVFERLVDVLGEPDASRRGPLGHWKADGRTVELWSQPSFDHGPGLRICGEPWRSEGFGELRPDLLLAVRAEDDVRVAVLDAKAYTAPVKDGVVDGELAKYLWGLRPTARDGRPERATFVNPLKTRAAVVAESRMEMLHAIPVGGGHDLHTGFVRGLLQLLEL